jgi:hypothetical protein
MKTPGDAVKEELVDVAGQRVRKFSYRGERLSDEEWNFQQMVLQALERQRKIREFIEAMQGMQGARPSGLDYGGWAERFQRR